MGDTQNDGVGTVGNGVNIERVFMIRIILIAVQHVKY
jgi:hypothetical protein